LIPIRKEKQAYEIIAGINKIGINDWRNQTRYDISSIMNKSNNMNEKTAVVPIAKKNPSAHVTELPGKYRTLLSISNVVLSVSTMIAATKLYSYILCLQNHSQILVRIATFSTAFMLPTTANHS
jgi:hypothetical protein